MIEKKRLELAKRQNNATGSLVDQNRTHARLLSGPIETSFNIMSNPLDKD